jgi:serine/threonine protein kinase
MAARPQPPDPNGEQALILIANELVEAMNQGQSPDRTALLARFPEYGDRLERLIEAAEMVVDLGASGSVELLPSARVEVTTPAEPQGQLGDFEILRELGRGGMGIVYEARQISLQRRVALKILPFASVLDPRQLQRFKNEALAAAQLNHPHIVDVIGVGCERGVHFYAMRLIDGQSLAEASRTAPLPGGGR